jgi:Lar family restriction alleviation protein
MADANAMAPCPFCGDGSNIFLRQAGEAGAKATACVQCESCGAIGPTWDAGDLDEGRDKSKLLVDLWNGRAALSEVA